MESKCKDCGKDISEFDAKYRGGFCWSCEKQRQQTELARQLQENEEVDTSGEDEITCPWCGYQLSDSWEMKDEDEYECDNCEKMFTYSRDVVVTYGSSRMPYGTCTECGAQNVPLHSRRGSISYSDICPKCKPIVQARKHKEYAEEIMRQVQG